MRYAKYFSVIGLVLFAFLVYSVGLEKIANAFLKINLPLFFAGFAVSIFTIVVKGFRQRMMVDAFGSRLGLWNSIKIWLMGYFLGSVTPGRSGDFFKAIYLSRRSRVSTGKCLTAVVVERLFDLSFLFIFAIVGMASFSAFGFSQKSSILFSLVGFFALFLLAIALLSQKRFVMAFLKPIFKFFVPRSIGKKLALQFNDFYAGLNLYFKQKRLMARLALLTIFGWVIAFVQYYLFALSVNVIVPFSFIAFVVPVLLLVSLLPISVAGIGTRDFTLVFFFSFLSIKPEAAISFSLAVLLSNLLVSGLGFVFFQKRPQENAVQ